MLEQLGVWSKLEAEAEPIRSMEITDSRTGDAVRPVFLTFEAQRLGGEPFAHMVPNEALIAALRGGGRSARAIVVTAPDIGGALRASPTGDVSVSLASGADAAASLLVAADGVRSRLRALAGIKTMTWRYPQIGDRRERQRTSARITAWRWSIFCPAGRSPSCRSRATARRSSGRSAATTAEKLMQGDDFVFLAELERRFGHGSARSRSTGRGAPIRSA